MLVSRVFVQDSSIILRHLGGGGGQRNVGSLLYQLHFMGVLLLEGNRYGVIDIRPRDSKLQYNSAVPYTM